MTSHSLDLCRKHTSQEGGVARWWSSMEIVGGFCLGIHNRSPQTDSSQWKLAEFGALRNSTGLRMAKAVDIKLQLCQHHPGNGTLAVSALCVRAKPERVHFWLLPCCADAVDNSLRTFAVVQVCRMLPSSEQWAHSSVHVETTSMKDSFLTLASALCHSTCSVTTWCNGNGRHKGNRRGTSNAFCKLVGWERNCLQWPVVGS